MFKVNVYRSNELFMTHSQQDFSGVLQIAVNSLISIQQQGGTDFRIEMTNKSGDVFFFAIGEKTKHPINITRLEDIPS